MQLLNKPIRVLIADDHALIREGFKSVFAGIKDFELIGAASDGCEVIQISNDLQPDVIIMDVRMPALCGRTATHTIMHSSPAIRIIAFSMYDDEHSLIQMRLAGAVGYLLKNSDDTEIFKAIRVVYEGGEYYCASIRTRMDALFLNGKLGASHQDKKINYSATELEIIKLMCQELTSKEIADRLHLNKRTVEHYKEHIQEKMGVQSSIGIAVYATNNWLL